MPRLMDGGPPQGVNSGAWYPAPGVPVVLRHAQWSPTIDVRGERLSAGWACFIVSKDIVFPTYVLQAVILLMVQCV